MTQPFILNTKIYIGFIFISNIILKIKWMITVNKKKWIIITGEEAGPKSNKMGGIWNVIDAEAINLVSVIKSDSKKSLDIGIIVAGPYYDREGSDWHTSLNRVTDLSAFELYEEDNEITKTVKKLHTYGMQIKTAVNYYKDIPIIYLMFDTSNYSVLNVENSNEMMCLSDKIKAEAYSFVGIDSLLYENMDNGQEYTHYLDLSYAVSEFIKELVTYKDQNQKSINDVYLHCHEFGSFYTIVRLKKLGFNVNSIATFHATIPGRSGGYKTVEKILNNDGTWETNVPKNFATLESFASYADIVTTVGETTKKEIKLFYDIDAIVVRNGIDTDFIGVDLEKKEKCNNKIQKFLSNNIHKIFKNTLIPSANILPIFSLSRIEIGNKGYPDLLDSLIVLDRIIKSKIKAGKIDENLKVVCFLITAHGPKSNLPEAFPINLPDDILQGEEIILQKMIKEKKLEPEQLTTGRRHVCALLYPQWISHHDESLNMNIGEFMAGCIAGIFPSRYEPFLLTGLEAGKEATPSIVSKICGFSDALKNIHPVRDTGGVIVVDNINLPYNEIIVDYALALDYLLDTYVDDKVKYSLICQEANFIANDMNWLVPVKKYYDLFMNNNGKNF